MLNSTAENIRLGQDDKSLRQQSLLDVLVEYAKAAAEEIRIRLTVCNRRPDNAWSWVPGGKPVIADFSESGLPTIHAGHPKLRTITCSLVEQANCSSPRTKRTTNVFSDTSPYAKDGFDNYIVHGETSGTNPAQCGTKAAGR